MLTRALDHKTADKFPILDKLIDMVPDTEAVGKFKVTVSPEELILEEPIATHVYRIVQELIANNLKHAQASQTRVSVTAKQNQLDIFYQDNGVGVEQLQKGNGLLNIEQRVEVMNGNVRFERGKDNGFSVRISIERKV